MEENDITKVYEQFYCKLAINTDQYFPLKEVKVKKLMLCHG